MAPNTARCAVWLWAHCLNWAPIAWAAPFTNNARALAAIFLLPATAATTRAPSLVWHRWPTKTSTPGKKRPEDAPPYSLPPPLLILRGLLRSPARGFFGVRNRGPRRTRTPKPGRTHHRYAVPPARHRLRPPALRRFDRHGGPAGSLRHLRVAPVALPGVCGRLRCLQPRAQNAPAARSGGLCVLIAAYAGHHEQTPSSYSNT